MTNYIILKPVNKQYLVTSHNRKNTQTNKQTRLWRNAFSYLLVCYTTVIILYKMLCLFSYHVVCIFWI